MRLVHGQAPRPGGGEVPPTTNAPSPIEEFNAPDDLPADARAVWLKQAPHAFKARTLTKATALAFERYCRMVAQERIEAQSSAANGPDHRGLRREINTLEIQFMLTATGKAIYDAEAQPSTPANPLSRFRS